MYKCVTVKIKETDTVYVALSDGLCIIFFFFFFFFLEGWVHGSEVRGTCRPLQVHCGMHPQGMPEKVRKAWGSHHML